MGNKLCALVGVLLLLAACAGPVVQEPSAPEQAPTDDKPAGDTGHQAAVTSLIDQAQTAYHQGEYQYAIASAERGLRIDRREPEFYLLLARSYLALAEPEQADEFARQGLRYSRSGSMLAEALESVREQLRAPGPTLTF